MVLVRSRNQSRQALEKSEISFDKSGLIDSSFARRKMKTTFANPKMSVKCALVHQAIWRSGCKAVGNTEVTF